MRDSADLSALLDRLAGRASALLATGAESSRAQGALTADGGICPDDRTALEFDPWRPDAHRCLSLRAHHSPASATTGAWARWQHLWLAERAAELAAVAALAGARRCRRRGERHSRAPTRPATPSTPTATTCWDPSRLFFSTYLESIWITNYLAAAALLREGGLLDPSVEEGVNAVADEAANLIGEFDEGFSNRQTWHNAALAAIAVWFEDEELAGARSRAPTGIIAHLVRGFGERRDVVRGRELPPVRAARTAARDGLGATGGRGPPRRSEASRRGWRARSGRPR